MTHPFASGVQEHSKSLAMWPVIQGMIRRAVLNGEPFVVVTYVNGGDTYDCRTQGVCDGTGFP